MKKTAIFIAIFLIVFYVSALAAPVPPTSDFFVNDYANVLSSETESFIMEKSAALWQNTKAQIVVLTVPDLGGKDRDSYALSVARDWNIGGVLILLSTDPDGRDIKIEVARGLEGALPDGKVGRIIDTLGMDSLKSGDYDTGITNIYKGVLNELLIEFNLETLPDYVPLSESENEGSALIGIIIFIVIVVILSSMNNKNFRGRGPRPPFFFFGGPGGFGGGGFGGGSGNSGGGFGGGGFSGGGGFGGFGGGGGGRSF